jgi:hypothetical protein
MYKSFIHPIYIIIDDLFNNGMHRLEIIDFGPPFCQIDADLVDGVLHRTILRTVRWTKNDTMSMLAHGLVNLRRTVRREVVVDEPSGISGLPVSTAKMMVSLNVPRS